MINVSFSTSYQSQTPNQPKKSMHYVYTTHIPQKHSWWAGGFSHLWYQPNFQFLQKFFVWKHAYLLWHLQDLGTYSSYEKPWSQHGQFCGIWPVHRLHYMLLVTTWYTITFVQTSANMCKLDKTTIFNNTTVEREQDTPVVQ